MNKSVAGVSNPKKLSNENSNLLNNFHVMEQIQLNLFDKQTKKKCFLARSTDSSKSTNSIY